MGVEVIFRCDGCDAEAKGKDTLRQAFRSFSGRSYGFGHAVPVNTVQDITPEGWWAYDPYTYCTYCPKCREEIESGPTQEQSGE